MDEPLDDAMRALAEPRWRAILRLVTGTEMAAGEIAAAFDRAPRGDPPPPPRRPRRPRTFAVSTCDIGRWWPTVPCSLGAHAVVDVTVPPEVGGAVVETRRDGSRATWGTITVWEPPTRFAMTWEVFAGGTEGEVVFRALGPALTRVELEHRGREQLSEQQVRTATATADGYTRGWDEVLAAFARSLEES
jgi:activator of Hsp90 ATPase-like protein